MKILIGYDGSDCSNAALDDLKMAGLPNEVEAVVISVVEAWLPPPPEGVSLHDYAEDLRLHPQPFRAWAEHAKEVAEAETLVKGAEERLRSVFPEWKITSEATYGSAGWEILEKAYEIKPDLMLVGSHGRSAIGRFFLGSISQKVLTEAYCSVRVARGRVEVDRAPARIVIGFDGSAGAEAAIEAVASRKWPKGSEVKVVTVSDFAYGAGIEPFAPSIAWVGKGAWMMEVAADAIQKLHAAGLSTEFVAEMGSPKNILVEIAEQWHADSIFVGANRFGSRIERFLLGSVSAAVAARAHCSVEVVRKDN